MMSYNNKLLSITKYGPAPFVNSSAIIFEKTYPTIKIGGIEWICENLDYQWPGLSIGDTSSSPQACYVEQNEVLWGWNNRKCGLLYNNSAMKYLQESGMLQNGWRVSTIHDLNKLNSSIFDYFNVGYHLTKNEAWASISGDNSINFNGKPCGARVDRHSQNLGDGLYINLYSDSNTKYMAYRRPSEELILVYGSYSGNWFNPIRLCRDV